MCSFLRLVNLERNLTEEKKIIPILKYGSLNIGRFFEFESQNVSVCFNCCCNNFITDELTILTDCLRINVYDISP
jgi:hypothetical protein